MTALAAPTNLRDFSAMFGTEEACRDYLFRVRWPNGYTCAICGSRSWHYVDPRGVIECGRKHQTSVTAGTIMHKTRTPLTVWFHAAYLVSSLTPGISALQFQKQLGFTRYETAFQTLHKLRSALVAPERERLKGTVEIDEAYIGGPEEGRPGRGAETKALVVCAVEIIRWFDDSGDVSERGHERRTMSHGPPEETVHEGKPGVWRRRAGRVRLSVIPDASADVLLPWIEKFIEPGTTVYTDGWSSYYGMTRMGYTHMPVLQSSKGQKTGRYLPMVHLMFSNLKRWLMGTHKGAVLPKHLPAYLNEFTFRFNRRFWRGPAFLRALGLVGSAPNEWPEYETLYATGTQGGWAHPNPKLRHVRPELVEGVIDGMWHAAPSDELRRWIEDNRPEIGARLKATLENANG